MIPPPVDVLVPEETPSVCFLDFRTDCPPEEELGIGLTGWYRPSVGKAMWAS